MGSQEDNFLGFLDNLTDGEQVKNPVKLFAKYVHWKFVKIDGKCEDVDVTTEANKTLIENLKMTKLEVEKWNEFQIDYAKFKERMGLYVIAGTIIINGMIFILGKLLKII